MPDDQPQTTADHPLLEGLWQTLPPVDTAWPARDRERWLDAARSIFDMLYKPGVANA